MSPRSSSVEPVKHTGRRAGPSNKPRSYRPWHDVLSMTERAKSKKIKHNWLVNTGLRELLTKMGYAKPVGTDIPAEEVKHD